jgi:hypothetical protein
MKENPNVEYQSTKKPNMFRISNFVLQISDLAPLSSPSARFGFLNFKVLKILPYAT